MFLAVLFVLVGPASAWLRKHPDKLNWPCFLIGFLPFVTTWLHLLTAPISWAWIGYTKGLEIWVLDFVAIAILIFLRGRGARLQFVIPMTLYFIATVIATVTAQIPEASFFYCWQLLRVFLLYSAVANVCAVEFSAVSSILTGLAVGEMFECLIAIWQRFGLHILQTPGTMESQNQLGLVSHFVILPFFAIMLGARRGWLPVVVVPAGLDNLRLNDVSCLGAVGTCGSLSRVALFVAYAILSKKARHREHGVRGAYRDCPVGGRFVRRAIRARQPGIGRRRRTSGVQARGVDDAGRIIRRRRTEQFRDGCERRRLLQPQRQCIDRPAERAMCTIFTCWSWRRSGRWAWPVLS